MEMTFLVKHVKWNKSYHKQFCSSKWAIYSKTNLFWSLEVFSLEINKNNNNTSLKVLKCDYLLKKLRITRKVIFSLTVWNGENLGKTFDFMETTIFVQTSEMGQILMKTVLFLKMSLIQLN